MTSPSATALKSLRSKMEGGNAAKADMKLGRFFVERKNGGAKYGKRGPKGCLLGIFRGMKSYPIM